jgi:hypothetical protein
MNTATHTVEVPFPQAFPGLTSWLFPSAPRYRRNGVPYAERDHQAVRRECALLRDSTLALSLLLGQHGRVFTPGPVPGNPPKRDSVVKVLEQGYYKEHKMSRKALGRGFSACGQRAFHPPFGMTGAFTPILCKKI